jgi:predicted nicotinamide N-methyase
VTATKDRSSADAAELASRWSAGLDGLQLSPVPLVPEIRLHLATDAVLLWARMEAEAGKALPSPFWATAWLGGQALARFILDHPDVVSGRRVLDLATGSGLVGIAACLAGAAMVSANDIDPYAIDAVAMNATANAVQITPSCASMLDEELDADVVLVGDAFYSPSMTETVLPVLKRAWEQGARVLVGDPGRADLPRDSFDVVATFPASSAAAALDAQLRWVYVLQFR